MIITIALFSLLSTPASADGITVTLPAPPTLVATRPAVSDKELTHPSFGTRSVTVDGCATSLAASQATGNKGGDLQIDLATAHRICQKADGDFLQAQAEAWATLATASQQMLRAPGEAALLASAGKALESGGNVRVESPDGLTVAGGDHLQWKAYAEGLATLEGGGQQYHGHGGHDPRFVDTFLLDQGRAAFMAHPAMPGTGHHALAVEPTSACGTAQECEQKVRALSSALANQD